MSQAAGQVGPAFAKAHRRNDRRARATALVAGLAVASLLAARPSASAILRVPSEQPTVRAAVDAAVSGDTILIAPGIHNGGVFINGKAVTLASWFLTTQDTTYVAQTVIDSVFGSCPLSRLDGEGLGERSGLLWVGEKFYPTPQDFTREAKAMDVRAVAWGVGLHRSKR